MSVDTDVAAGYVEAAALNVMRLPCTAKDPCECLRCIASNQLSKALTALADQGGE